MSTNLKPELVASLDEALEKLENAQSSNEIALFFEVPEGQLLFLLYEQETTRRYKHFQIPKKSGGYRNIHAPIGGTDILQKKILPILQKIYRVKPCVHGFVSGKSVLSNAKKHTNKKYVLNIDLEDFYGSINFGRVRGMLMAEPLKLGPSAASVLAQLLVLDNKLPQGACTSPVVSNLISVDLDRRMIRLASRYKLQYTRYADDLTFSTTKSNFPTAMATHDGSNPITGMVSLGDILLQEVAAAGFTINFGKVRLQIKGYRQEVTGLTVNDFPNVNRKFFRKIRAQLYAWKNFGINRAAKRYCQINLLNFEPDKQADYFKSVIYGELAYLKMIRGETDFLYIKLCLKLATLDEDPPKFIQKVKLVHDKFDLFICHASEDKESVCKLILEACEQEGVKAFLDVKYIAWGDSLTEKINHAMGQSKFVLAVLSDHSVEKAWPIKEINSALAREISGKQKILPLVVGKPNLDRLPLLQDKLFMNWNNNAQELAKKIKEMLT